MKSPGKVSCQQPLPILSASSFHSTTDFSRENRNADESTRPKITQSVALPRLTQARILKTGRNSPNILQPQRSLVKVPDPRLPRPRSSEGETTTFACDAANLGTLQETARHRQLAEELLRPQSPKSRRSQPIPTQPRRETFKARRRRRASPSLAASTLRYTRLEYPCLAPRKRRIPSRKHLEDPDTLVHASTHVFCNY